MEPATAFKQLIDRVQILHIPLSARKHLERRLEYFHRNALCDLDRRDSETKLSEVWRALLNEARGSGLIEFARKDKQLWSVVTSFVGEPTIEDVFKAATPFHPSPSAPARPKTLEESIADPQDFFRELIRRVEGAVWDDGKEKLIALLGLRYLLAEAKRGRNTRDLDTMGKTWNSIWPILNRRKVLDDFRRSTVTKSKITFFFTNKMT